MRKGDIELLAPAGSFEALVAAVQCGANAVYVGGQQFGARAFANNFDHDSLIEAVHYCHLRGVALYVTVNTLYNDSQFDELIEYTDFLYKIGVDAFIIQDTGFFSIARKRYPDIELHMSTQVSVRNKEGVQYFQDLGVERVVLAREMNIKDIHDLCHATDIDIEVFVHGALCMSYSGQCLMSSMIAKRSGNRGKCGQPCRLPYDLIEDGKNISKSDHYLLSPKDLCSIDHVGELIEAGIKSFKVEGRMKRPEYVASVISAYRKAIDAYLEKKHINTEDEKLKMEKVFNRGFTGGFLFQDSLNLSKDIPGNRGTLLGSIDHYSSRDKMLFIRLKDELYQNDRIFFPNEDLTRTITKLYKNGRLVNHGDIGDLVQIELNSKINLKQNIYKVVDYKYLEQIQKYLKDEHIHNKIDMKVSGQLHDYLSLTIDFHNHHINVQSDVIIDEAINRPLDQQRIIDQLSKLGNTQYTLNKIHVDFPSNGILPIKELNNMRRKAIDALNEELLNVSKEISTHTINATQANTKPNSKRLAIKVFDISQLNGIQTDKVDEIFVPFYQYTGLEKHIPYVPFLYDETELTHFIDTEYYKQCYRIMVSDFGAYQLVKEKDVILSSNFNILNQFTLDEFQRDTVLSLEMSQKEINALHHDHSLYMIAYSHLINMNLKHCIISDHYFGSKHKNCHLCQKHHYQLKDRKGELFDITTDQFCNNYISHCKKLYIQKINDFKVDVVLLDFINEDTNYIQMTIDDFSLRIFKDKNRQITDSLDIFKGYYF